MSTIVAQTLSNGTVSTSTANCIQGSAKAWCNYNGVAQTIRSSYNISSVTYNGTGDYTFNFTNAFADNNYCFTFGQQPEQDIGFTSKVPHNVSTATTSIRVQTGTMTGINQALSTCISIFR